MGLLLDVVICWSTCGIRKLAVFGLKIFAFETSENFNVNFQCDSFLWHFSC